MSLQFIFGGAGSGKSTYLNRRMIAEAEAHPEQRFLGFLYLAPSSVIVSFIFSKSG